jgi:integrase
MANFNFYLKDGKSDSPTPIFLRIQSNQSMVKWFFKQKIHPKEWDSSKQRASKKYSELNVLLNNYASAAEKISQRLLDDNKTPPSPKDIKTELDKKFNTSYKPKVEREIKTLQDFKDLYIPLLQNKVNPRTENLTTKSTITSIKQTFAILEKFRVSDYCKKETFKNHLLNDIDLEFHKGLMQYMKNENYRTNTIAKHVKNLKSILNEAQELEYISKNRYKGKYFVVPTERANNIYLNELELKQFIDLDLTDKPYLDRIRDVFILGCYTGLRFSDYSDLDKGFFESKHGKTILTIKTQKGQKEVVIPILPFVENILNKYRTEGELELPKPISNQKFNKYLKELAQLVPAMQTKFPWKRTIGGNTVIINKPKWELVTTHTARRSFATNMYKRNINVPMIMAITGHTTEKSFYTYIQMKPKEHATQFLTMFDNSKASNY